jgi:hypothetical protein
MTNPTSNFGWQMPTSTDLVTDLPADFEVFGQAVDTDFVDLLGGTTGQVLSKTSATDLDFTWVTANPGDITGVTAGTGISGGGTSGTVTVSIDTAVTADLTTSQTLTNKTLTSPALTTPTISTLTTNGDLLYGTGSGALARTAIGSTGQVLTVAAGIPSWATPASSGGLTLLSTTTMSGGTVTVSSLSTYKQLVMVFRNVYVNSNNYVYLQFNGDTGNNYSSLRLKAHDTNVTATAYGAGVSSGFAFNVGDSATATNKLSGVITVYAADQTSGSSYVSNTGFNDGTGNTMTFVNGRYFNTAVISSVLFGANAASFSGGTLMIYGAN